MDDDGSIVTELGPDWPFPGRARRRFRRVPGRLRRTVEVLAGVTAMPATAGSHPRFASIVVSWS